MNRPTLIAWFLTIAAGVAAPATTSSAQGLEQSRIEGVLRDQAGAAMPDVNVTLDGTGLIGGSRRVMTDEHGRFHFKLLPPGIYVLNVAHPGFAPLVRRDLILPLGTTLTVDGTLSIAGRTETVNVDARGPAIDVRSPALVTNIDERTLQLLPIRRSYPEVLALTPGIANPTVVPGLIVAYGGTLGSNGLYVDGVDATEPRRQAAQLPINYNWLDQVQVVALGAGAQYGEFTGATALGVLRAGSNRFSGLGEYWTSRWSWIDRNGSSLAGREVLSLWDSTAQVGGPIRQDRFWFFAGLEVYRKADRPLGYSGDLQASEYTRRMLVKLTSAPAHDSRLEGHVQWNGLDRSAANASRFITASALSEVWQRDVSWNVRWTQPFGEHLLLEARSGGYVSDYWDRPMEPNSTLGPTASIESTTNLSSNNASTYQRLRPTQTNSIVSVMRDVAAPGGHHALRAGFEYKWSESLDARGFPGGERLITTAGRVASAQLWAGDKTTAIGQRTALYVQDQWTAHLRLTIDAGLRLDLNRGSTPEGGVVFSTTPWSPRIGAAWVIDRNHKSALKASAGRYHDSLLTERVGFMDIPGLSPRAFYSINAEGTRVPAGQSAPLTARGIDGAIRHSYVDQFVIGYEREAFSDVLLQTHYIRRRFDNFMVMTETALDWEPVSFGDPGNDGVNDTADDGPRFTAYRQMNPVDKFLLLTNPANAYRRYDGLQAVLRKRWSRNWQVQASYTWSRTTGTVGNTDYVNAALNETGEFTGSINPGTFTTPNGLINADGRAAYDLRELKIIGGFEIDALDGFLASAIVQHRNGNRWERKLSDFGTLIPNDFQTIRLEPRGSRTTPSIWNVDLRVQKVILRFGMGRQIGIAFDIFNLTNQGEPLIVYPIVGPSFAMPLTRSDPRTLRVVARATF